MRYYPSFVTSINSCIDSMVIPAALAGCSYPCRHSLDLGFGAAGLDGCFFAAAPPAADPVPPAVAPVGVVADAAGVVPRAWN